MDYFIGFWKQIELDGRVVDRRDGCLDSPNDVLEVFHPVG